jgi:hypothetical protein
MENQLLLKRGVFSGSRKLLSMICWTFCLLIVGRVTSTAQVNANEVQVSGEIRDEKNSIVPGASVVLQGTTKGTTTDANGKFRSQCRTQVPC